MAKYDLQDEAPHGYDLQDEGASVAKEAPASESMVQAIKRHLKEVGAGVGKLADIPSAALRGGAAGVYQMATGKEVMSNAELAAGLNPFSYQRAPDLSEMAKRAGIGNPSLSDLIPGAYVPAGEGRLFHPEKGGILDPTAAGVTQFATDPVNLLSMGGKSATKAALDAGAVRQALGGPGVIDQASQMLAMPARAAVEALPGGTAAAAAVNGPSAAVAALGRRLYRSVIQPVEYQGQKFGKQDVAGTLYDAGIKTPFGLRGKADAATSTIMGARDRILESATESGGKASMARATAPLQEQINKIRTSRDPHLQDIADTFQAKLDDYRKLEQGTPAVPPVPARSVELPSSLVDTHGQPIMKSELIPGTPGRPAVPPQLVTPTEASGFKSSLYNGLPNTAYDNAIKTPKGAQLQKTLSRGMREETESATGQALGPQAEKDLAELNAASGKLLTTKRSQVTVQNQADRQLDRTFSPTGSDAVMAGVGEAARHGGGAKAVAIKHLMDAIRMATMPVGYGLQKAAENPASATAINAWFYQKMKNLADTQAQGGPRQARSPYDLQEQ